MSRQDFSVERLNKGNVQQCHRRKMSGVEVGGPFVHFDAHADTDTLDNPSRSHSFAVDEHVWIDDAPGQPVSGLPLPRDAWIVSVNGDVIQVSTTQGGQPANIGSDGRVVMATLLADLRESVGNEVLFGFRQIGVTMTEERGDELQQGIQNMLWQWAVEDSQGG